VDFFVDMMDDPAEVDQAIAEALRSLRAARNAIEPLETQRMLGGEHDNMGAILTINAGAGGTESQDWAEMLLRMYTRFCERKGFSVNLVDLQAGQEAGIKSAELEISGPFAYGFLKAEIGVHRLVRVSPFDSAGRRHTSFASVYCIPDLDDEIKVDIEDKDIRIDTFRASGAGGQHVNKTDSAIRITHIPTNIVVQCQNERSQHKNKATALKLLMAKLLERERREREKETDAANAQKRAIEWGSQIRSYVLYPYRMVKDLRTDFETSNTDDVLDGDLERFITAYLLLDSNKPSQATP
jgi:peptide chain release factor 2